MLFGFIAKALVNDPVMILVDEVKGDLDSRTSYEIMMLLQDLNNDHGKTIVFVTHEPGKDFKSLYQYRRAQCKANAGKPHRYF